MANKKEKQKRRFHSYIKKLKLGKKRATMNLLKNHVCNNCSKYWSSYGSRRMCISEFRKGNLPTLKTCRFWKGAPISHAADWWLNSDSEHI